MGRPYKTRSIVYLSIEISRNRETWRVRNWLPWVVDTTVTVMINPKSCIKIATTDVNQAYAPHAANARLLILSDGRQWNLETNSSVGWTPNRPIFCAKSRSFAARKDPSSSFPLMPVAMAKYDNAERLFEVCERCSVRQSFSASSMNAILKAADLLSN